LAASRQLKLFGRARDIVDVISLVAAEHFNVDIRVLRSSTRRQPYAHVRQIVMFVAQDVGGLGPAEIGESLARDHSTVVHGIKEVKAVLEYDPYLRRSLGLCLEKARAVVAALDQVTAA
jgi:chromosomal replication initiation ATPase DnaA